MAQTASGEKGAGVEGRLFPAPSGNCCSFLPWFFSCMEMLKGEAWTCLGMHVHPSGPSRTPSTLPLLLPLAEGKEARAGAYATSPGQQEFPQPL